MPVILCHMPQPGASLHWTKLATWLSDHLLSPFISLVCGLSVHGLAETFLYMRVAGMTAEDSLT